MRHVMVDLETLGIVPGCVILSIGAVAFDPTSGDMDAGFYQAVKVEGQVENGLHISPSTSAWWAKQSAEARRVFSDPDAVVLPEALRRFNAYLAAFPDALVFGNGADFDNPILAAAYRAADEPQGWKPYNGRCYRTIKSMAPGVRLTKRQGTHHNALDDAISQAVHLCEIARACGFVLA